MNGSLRLLLLIFAVLVPARVPAGAILIGADQDSYPLNGHADLLVDPQGRLTLADVVEGRAADSFLISGADLPSFGFGTSVFWFRFTLDNASSEERKMRLVLRANWLDSVSFFGPGANGGFRDQLLDKTLTLSSRLYQAPRYLIDVSIAPGSHTYYLRLNSRLAFLTAMELMSPESFLENERLWSVYYGMLCGILLVVGLYSGFNWASTRDRAYLYFFLYLAALWVMNFSHGGFSYQSFWAESPGWSNWSHTTVLAVFQIAAVLFSMVFLESKVRFPYFHLVFQALLGILIVGWIAVTVAGDPAGHNALSIFFVLTSAALILCAGMVALKTGYRAARLHVAAFLVCFVGSLWSAFAVSGYLTHSFASIHAADFGVLANVVLASLALVDRNNLAREQNEAAKQQVLDQNRHANELLARVNEDLERTTRQHAAELSRARDLANRVARIDVLTGIANRRSFEETSASEFARARRYQHGLSVILLDIDQVKRINDDYGHAAGDSVIWAVASVIKETVREADCVARLGGGEFVVLLPEIDVEEAIITAERLKERIASRALEHDGRNLVFTVSLGVSQLMPIDPAIEAAIQRAEQAMYAAKDAGQNQVVGFTPSDLFDWSS